jgi:dsDNA-specific endonuclease/ATPase MutS2
MSDPMNEELDFNVGEDEQEATVEMNEDGSDATLSVEQGKKAGPAEEELEDYSGKVKKRIDKLTARLRETQRREEAALEYAKNVQQQNQRLEQVFQQTDTQRLEEMQNRVGTQLMALKHVIKKAREEGDIDTETEAQQRLTTMVMEQQRLNATTNDRKRQAANPRQVEQPEIFRKRQPEPDIRAEEWAEQNAWFGTNTVMTHTVRGIHMDLVQKEGFDPSSDEYYSEIDRRMSRDISQ